MLSLLAQRQALGTFKHAFERTTAPATAILQLDLGERVCIV